MHSFAGVTARRATWLIVAIAVGFAFFAAQAADTSAQATPSVQLSKTEVNPDGDTITVTGSGFTPDLAVGTRPPLASQPAGVYIAFGAFADVWKPSEGAPSSARPTTPMGQGGSALIWALPPAGRAIIGEEATVLLNADGTFEATLTVQRDYEGALADGNYGIYTYAGSGAIQPLFETFTPVTFVGGAEPTVPATAEPTSQPTSAPTSQPTSAPSATPAAPPTGSGEAIQSASNTGMYLAILGVIALMGSTVMVAATVRANRRP